ncbi:MAG TPA: hypothetical protein HPQ04_11810 [Rhodospirillaceae bacterium]|nr:hypothetical protein [Rhodospirillaceae bacterium]
MVRLILSLLIGGLIVLVASSNSHIVETRLGPLWVSAPHFVVLGVTFFMGFATAVFTMMGQLLKRKKNKSPGKSIVINR